MIDREIVGHDRSRRAPPACWRGSCRRLRVVDRAEAGGRQRLAVFFAAAFFFTVFLAAGRLAVDFLAVAFLAVDFLAAAFLLAVFFAGAAEPSSTPRPSLGAWDGLSTASLKPFRAVMRARL